MCEKKPFLQWPWDALNEKQKDVADVLAYESETAITYPFCVNYDMVTEKIVNDIVDEAKRRKVWTRAQNKEDLENRLYDICELVLGAVT